MGTVFLHGNGGSGGGGLNFRVIGGTSAPTNPKENDIWVNTDVKITSYIFSATEPGSPAEGMVWISVGISSSIEFNALKKNGIQVYPISAKQYIGGVWTDVTAMSYQGGTFVTWIVYLYNLGDECKDLTGGWATRAWAYDSNYKTKTPTLTKNADSLTIAVGSSSNETDNGSGVVEVLNDIDVTNISTIKANFKSVTVSGSANSTYYPMLAICLVNRNATYFGTNKVAGTTKSFTTIKTTNSVVLDCDVSKIKGSYDIVIGITCHRPSSSNQTITAVLESVEMN